MNTVSSKCPSCDREEQCLYHGLTGKSHDSVVGVSKKDPGITYEVKEWGFVCANCYISRTIKVSISEIEYKMQELRIRMDLTTNVLVDLREQLKPFLIVGQFFRSIVLSIRNLFKREEDKK